VAAAAGSLVVAPVAACRGWAAGSEGLGRVPRRAPCPSRAGRAPQWRPAARPDCRGVAADKKKRSGQTTCRVATSASGSRRGGGAPTAASAGGGVSVITDATAHGGWRSTATNDQQRLRKTKQCS